MKNVDIFIEWKLQTSHWLDNTYIGQIGLLSCKIVHSMGWVADLSSIKKGEETWKVLYNHQTHQRLALGIIQPSRRYKDPGPGSSWIARSGHTSPRPVDVKLRVAGQRRTNVLEPESGEGEGVTLHCHWSRHQRELVLQTIYQFSKLVFTSGYYHFHI